ncbi:hypothetical protein K488DRAFT_74879 [Vararia minispora EC-137]|uniref:Uncharacterized protein n=1 Tax=Vararia minispora EC-137 TaxID=1314806 RepID=A0ACB8Q6B7_9AGAM|nr:hypothetical protein K488DRAFT_74879 [Vararia minispora EC-137]
MFHSLPTQAWESLVQDRFMLSFETLLQSFSSWGNRGDLLSPYKTSQLAHLVCMTNAAIFQQQDPKTVAPISDVTTVEEYTYRSCLFELIVDKEDFSSQVRRDVLLSSLRYSPPSFMCIQRLVLFMRTILSYALLPDSPVAAHTDIWKSILYDLHELTMELDFRFLPDESCRIIWKIYQVFGRDNLMPEAERLPWDGDTRTDLNAIFEQWPVLEETLRSLADAIVAQAHSRSVVLRSSALAIVLSAEFKVQSRRKRRRALRGGDNQENHEDSSEGRVVRRCSSAPAIALYTEHDSRQPVDSEDKDYGDIGLDPHPASGHIPPDNIV